MIFHSALDARGSQASGQLLEDIPIVHCSKGRDCKPYDPFGRSRRRHTSARLAEENSEIGQPNKIYDEAVLLTCSLN